MKKINLVYVLFLVLFFSCNTNKKDATEKEDNTTAAVADKSELLLGIWEISVFINSDEVRKAFKGDIVEGMSGEMTLTGEFQFIKGNRFNDEGETTLRLTMNNQELPLKFFTSQSGTWKIHGNTIVTVTEDSKIVALDDFTKNVLANAPGFEEMMKPNKGEATSFEIITLTESTLQLITDDVPGITFTYNKK